MNNADHSFQIDAQPENHQKAFSVKELQNWLKENLGEILEVKPADIDIGQPFNEYGLSSTEAVVLSGELAELLGCELPPALVYDYPTIARLAQHLVGNDASHDQTTDARTTSEPSPVSGPIEEDAIAIIGMACRFPGGANTPDAFWQLLRQGKSATTEIPSQRWNIDDYYDPSPEASGKMYTRYGCFLENIELFDANFFGFSPREAVRMDPQHRLLAEVAWEAMENAALAVDSLAGSQTGVFIGMMNNYEYTQLQIQGDGSWIDDPYFGTGSASSMVSGRLAYLFDFRGPTLTVDTACSSSLVSLHLACQSLRNNECTLALVGGANTLIWPENVVNACKMGMLSADGRCKTFDASADGFVLGEGCGVVVLKPLSQARADGNTVLAIVRGSAINQDGQSNGITAPNKLAQEAVIRKALACAGVTPERISYVEAHGSGTALGDPIEIGALQAVLGVGRSPQQHLLVGSVKTNIGHLAGAAGIAGLIKTVLALQHREIPPHLNLQRLNPHISQLQALIAIPTELTPWHVEKQTRIAGVSSFGWSGTNAHVVLEEAPLPEDLTASRSKQLLILSARTGSALETMITNLRTHLQNSPELALADLTFTLQTGRKAFAHRYMQVCSTVAEAIDQLESRQGFTTFAAPRERPLAFLFPGQGTQYANMGSGLYSEEATFRAEVDRCSELLKPYLKLDVREILYPSEDGIIAAQQQLNQTSIAEPVLFMIEYALAKQWMKWGIYPQSLLGHGIGEYVAACLAGIFSLEDALTLVSQRARLIQELPESAMLAVALSEQDVQPYVNERVNLAIVNAPRICVLAGPTEDIQQLEIHLEKQGIAQLRVETTHAFHSAMLVPLQEALTCYAQSIQLNPPRIPCLSNVTGTWITDEQATNPAYWAQHMCQTVRFTDGVAHLLQDTETVLLEVGPGQALSSFVRQHPLCTSDRMASVLTTFPPPMERRSKYEYLLLTLGKLWLTGVSINWQGFYTYERRRRIPLPPYPFERQRYWIEPRRQKISDASVSPGAPMRALKKEELSHWFYLPGWKQVAPPRSVQLSTQKDQCWLFFPDASNVSARIIDHLKQQQQSIVTVVQGTSFKKYNEMAYAVRPGERTDYEALLSELQESGKLPSHVAHLWAVTPDEEQGEYDTQAVLEAGFYSLLYLTQALQNVGLQTCSLSIISSRMQNVIGNEPVCPEKAVIIGPCRVIPQECPTFRCQSIDIIAPMPGTQQENLLISQLVAELNSEHFDTVVALRGNRRWVQTFEPMVLDGKENDMSPLRNGGVYLISGGLGGIGLAIGEHLVRTIGARLVLVGRTGLPPRHEWDQILAEADDVTWGPARVIHIIQTLEAQGAQILILQADVRSKEQMRSVIAQAQKRFGELHGVFHTAGVPGAGLLQFKTSEQAREVLGPKVDGTLVLKEVLTDTEVELVVLFSSVTAWTGGGPGQIDYSAANAFLGAYAQSQSGKGRQVVAIDWNEWQWNAWEAGMAGFDNEIQSILKENRRRFGITFEEGIEALKRVLATNLPQVIVSSQDFLAMVEESKRLTATYILQQKHSLRSVQETHPRPELVESYVPARNEVEQRIISLWETLLGITPVGINDNFFELGGNSLAGIDLIARLRKMFQLETLAAHVLYEAPTVSKMALYIGNGKSDQEVKERLERGEKRRENQKHSINASKKIRRQV